MSERGRIVAIFAAVAAIGAGGGYYYLRIYQPRQVRQQAQDEITAWETRWTAARSCLLGATPGSSKTSEAIAIREMTPDPWERGKCTPLISKLTRGDAPDTGLAPVEAAWTDLDHAASKAAQAFATHVAAINELPSDPLAGALDALDAAHDKLRAAAGLPADAKTGKPLPAAQIFPINDGGKPLVELSPDSLPSAHGAMMFGKTDSRLLQINVVAGAKPAVGRVGPGSLRGIPDPKWGASPGTGEIRAGAFDAEGALPAATPLRLEVESAPIVAAVIGTQAEGEIIYGADASPQHYGALVIGHSHSAALTAGPPERTTFARVAVDADARAVLLWADTNKEPRGQIITPKADEPVVKLPEALGDGACLSVDRAWTRTASGKLLAFGGTGKPVVMEAHAPLIGCSADGAVLREFSSAPQLSLCTDACRPLAMPKGAPDLAAVAITGGKIVAMAAHGGVLAVWRDDSGPTFYSATGPLHWVFASDQAPLLGTSDGKVIDVLARGDKDYVVVQIPAS